MGYNGSYIYGTRQLDIMGCLNKWSTINFSDGTKVQAYLTSFDFSYTGGYLTRSGLRSITCQGTAIQTTQQGQGCLNNWVQVTFPNGVSLQMYLTFIDDSYVGGSFQTSGLMALSGQVSSIEC
jgi:hypothetical protein